RLRIHRHRAGRDADAVGAGRERLLVARREDAGVDERRRDDAGAAVGTAAHAARARGSGSATRSARGTSRTAGPGCARATPRSARGRTGRAARAGRAAHADRAARALLSAAVSGDAAATETESAE